MSESDDLRKKAEKRVQIEQALTGGKPEAPGPEPLLRTLHELRVHQIELEMQNEELRRAQEDLESLRARYFDLYDLAPVAYFTLSEEGLIHEANLCAATLLDLARTLLVNQPFSRFILRDDQDLYYLNRKRLLATGERRTFELRMVKTDGTVFWGHLESCLAEDALGARGCRITVNDFTDRKAQEDELEATAHLVGLINTPGDYHEYLSTLANTLQSWSGCEAVGIRLRSGEDFPYFETRGFPPVFVQAESQLCTRDPEGQVLRDASGKPLLDCMCGNVLCGRFDPALPFFTSHGSFWANSTTALLASTSEADRQTVTRNHCNSNGYESVALIPLRIGPQVLGLLQFNDHRPNRFTPDCIAHLERLADALATALSGRQAEEALRESENRYRQLFEAESDAILLVDCAEGRILEANRAATVLYGYTRAELLGMRNTDLSAEPEGTRGRTIAGVDGSEQIMTTPHCLNRKKDGTLFPVELTGRFFLSQGRKVLISAVRDVSERERVEDERRRFDERMNQMQKLEALGVLVAGVAHNLNNVLAAIMATASLRERLATDPQDLEAYRIIDTACRRGRDVVKSLTLFAQPSLAVWAPIQLQSLITELRILLESTTRNRIEILEAFTGEPLWINGDAGNLSNAFMNLALNALDAMPTGGTLTFRALASGEDWVEVAVEDSGEGMTPEILARAAEPFFSTKPVGKGTGLGLSMTHGVIKAHGGTMELFSSQGMGTIVKLRFPRIQAPAPSRTEEAPPQRMESQKVLLVDDDESVRSLVARMLQAAGLEVETAAGGEEALEVLRAGAPPDVIILDQNMPRMNGIQTMEKIREVLPSLPILISSGQPDIQDWECFKRRNVSVIPKPFEMKELLAKLAQIALRSKARR